MPPPRALGRALGSARRSARPRALGARAERRRADGRRAAPAAARRARGARRGRPPVRPPAMGRARAARARTARRAEARRARLGDAPGQQRAQPGPSSAAATAGVTSWTLTTSARVAARQLRDRLGRPRLDVQVGGEHPQPRARSALGAARPAERPRRHERRQHDGAAERHQRRKPLAQNRRDQRRRHGGRHRQRRVGDQRCERVASPSSPHGPHAPPTPRQGSTSSHAITLRQGISPGWQRAELICTTRARR